MKLIQCCRVIGVAALCFQALSAQAQPGTDGGGSLLGTIRDPSGAAIIGAHLRLKDRTGQVKDTQTDREGAYHFSRCVPGTIR